mgnify:CR=1 FL=1
MMLSTVRRRLLVLALGLASALMSAPPAQAQQPAYAAAAGMLKKIGRASCRERV